MCFAGGRQTHFVAETILRRAKAGDDVTIFAYSFDHPIVTTEIIDAVYRGARVSIYMDYKYLLGENKSKYGNRLLADALGNTARARRPGRLRIFSQEGRGARAVYESTAGAWCHPPGVHAMPKSCICTRT